MSFWENYSKGPRKLTSQEEANLRRLEDRIDSMEREGGARNDTVLFGKKIRNPIGIASGPAPNSRWLTFFSRLGYGILTYKTMRDREWRGYGIPNLLNVRGDFQMGFVAVDGVTGSMTNSLGMPAPKPRIWKQDAHRMALTKGDRFFVISVTATVQGGSEEDMLAQFAELAGDSKRSGADAVELNLSCPNILPGEGGETYADAKLSGRVVDTVRKTVGSGYPIFIKVGHLNDYHSLVDETYDERVAYVAINSVPGVVRSSSGATLFLDRGGSAGICGAAIREMARDAVSKLSGLRRGGKEFEIIGLGGILGGPDALALMKEGADAVECATGALLDPCLGLKINLDILKARGRGDT